MSLLDVFSAMRIGAVAALPGVGVYHVPAQTVKEASNKIKELERTVDQRGQQCKEAKVLMESTPATVMIYITRTERGRSTIGTDIAQNNESKCGDFLKAYYKWLSEEYERESKIIPMPIEPSDIPIPDIPKIPPFPSFPDPSAPFKAIFALIVFFMLAMVALVALGYSGLGGSVGRVAEGEYKRKR